MQNITIIISIISVVTKMASVISNQNPNNNINFLGQLCPFEATFSQLQALENALMTSPKEILLENCKELLATLVQRLVQFLHFL